MRCALRMAPEWTEWTEQTIQRQAKGCGGTAVPQNERWRKIAARTIVLRAHDVPSPVSKQIGINFDPWPILSDGVSCRSE